MGRLSNLFYSIGDFFSKEKAAQPETLFTPEGLSTRDDAIEMLAKAYSILSEDNDALLEAKVRAQNLQLQEELIKAIPFEDVSTRDNFKFQEYNDRILLNQLYSSDLRPSGISNTTLRTIAFRSPLVNQIIARRANQMEQFAKPQRNKNELGFVIRPKSGEAPTLRQKEDIKRLRDAISNLGFLPFDNFRGTFKDFIQLIIRDSLTLV